MVGANVPAAEVDVTLDLVASLLAEQRPHLADLPLEIMGNGWDNVSVLIGDALVGRFPRRLASVELIENEARWLPVLGPGLPLPIPVPVFLGEPSTVYPWPWSIAPLLPGSPANEAELDFRRCADQLGRFLRALHVPAHESAPVNPFRGVPLGERDPVFRERLADLSDFFDVDAMTRAWGASLEAKAFTGAPVWLHGDFQPHNLLAANGEISAVVDFGDITAGDPATDLSIAWSLLPEPMRHRLWDEYGHQDADLVARAKGWALNLGTAISANSADNPAMLALGVRTVQAVLSDPQF